jgi:hypothetical protein
VAYLLLGLLPLLVLLFPTGRLPSRHWRPVVWVFATGLFLYAASVVLKPGPLHNDLPVTNPLGLEPAEELLQLIGAALFWLFALFVILVLTSLVLRFRRSRGTSASSSSGSPTRPPCWSCSLRQSGYRWNALARRI